MNDFLLILLTFYILAAAASDLRSYRIPNRLTYPVMALALACHGIANGIEGIWFSAGGLALGIGLLLVPYLMEGMGAGDAKMLGAIGAIIGAKKVFVAFLFTGIAGGIYALLMILVHRNHFHGLFQRFYCGLVTFFMLREYVPVSAPPAATAPKLCYGLAIAAGTGLYMVFERLGLALPLFNLS